MKVKRKGMVWGAFVADALALGAHWVYNTRVIDKKFGRVERYLDPLTSYHAGKKKGDFTHYGDQLLLLLESVATSSGFDQVTFANAWQSFFKDYQGYRDKASKTTLENMLAGNSLLESGSSSDDLAGAARISPIVYAHAQDLDTAIQAVRSQTALTHNHPSVLESAEFFTRLAFKVLEGKRPSEAIPELLEKRFQDTEIAEAGFQGLASREMDTRAAIAEFGQTCSVEAAFPGTVHVMVKFENNFKDAMVENVMAGGDSAARGILAGMIIGAHLGLAAVPEDWLATLNAGPKIDRLLSKL